MDRFRTNAAEPVTRKYKKIVRAENEQNNRESSGSAMTINSRDENGQVVEREKNVLITRPNCARRQSSHGARKHRDRIWAERLNTTSGSAYP